MVIPQNRNNGNAGFQSNVQCRVGVCADRGNHNPFSKGGPGYNQSTENTLSAFERTIKLVDFTDYLNCF